MSIPTGDGKRQQALDRALQQIEKTYGKGAIMQLDGNVAAAKDGMSTGALSLDLALGGFGIPRGRIIEIFGPESSGKTTLALHVVASAQRGDGVAAFVDAEHALDPSWMRRCGVNSEAVLVSQPDCGEQALEITDMLVRSNAVDVIVVDSVAALVPKAELEGEMGQAQVGAQARLMSQGMRKLTSGIAKSRTIVIFINQIREKIGVMFGSPETTPGGRALKFYSSVRIDVRRIASLKEGERVIGSQVRARVVKNKVAPPFRETQFDIMFDSGISSEGDLLDLGIKHTIIEKQGAWLRYGDVQLGQGRENAKAFLKDNRDLWEEIRRKILEVNGLIGPAKDTPSAPKGESDSNAKPASPPSKSAPLAKPRGGATATAGGNRKVAAGR